MTAREQARALLAKRVPSMPWSAEAIRLLLRYASKHEGPWCDHDEDYDVPIQADAALIAAAPTLLAALCDELDAALETNTRLNRRCQTFESGVLSAAKESGGRSLGRGLANAAAEMYRQQAEAAEARCAKLEALLSDGLDRCTNWTHNADSCSASTQPKDRWCWDCRARAALTADADRSDDGD